MFRQYRHSKGTKQKVVGSLAKIGINSTTGISSEVKSTRHPSVSVERSSGHSCMDRHVSLTVTLLALIIFSHDIGFTAGCRKGKSFHYSNPGTGVSKITSNPYRIVKSSPLVSHIKASTSSVLLSVDLGLRSGFAFYNSTGSLLSFEYHRFDTLPKLEASVLTQLNIASKVHDITHFALEGDNVYRSIWTSAINQYAAERKKEAEIINVKPSEWRARILTNSERKSGKDAKCAARQICRQIMYRSGMEVLNRRC